jgi:signal transduction histidine kinase
MASNFPHVNIHGNSIENEHLLKNVFSSSTDCIKVLDLHGRLVSMNENGQRIAEIDDITSFIGGFYIDLWMDSKDAATKALNDARNGDTGRFVGWLPTLKTNTPKWWDVVITPIPDMFGTPEQLLVVARDITEYTLLQEELQNRNRELLKTNNDLDNFIYTASHDLRSPITNIEGLLHTLKATLNSGQSDKLNEADLILELIDRTINKFKRTILDLTEISKVQRTNEEDIHQINCSEIIEDVLFSIQDKVTESGAAITINTDACNHLIFSTKNFKSIIYNLLSNAIKYRHPDRSLEITVLTKKINDTILLSIEDNGLGISSGHLPKLFSMFKRFHTHVEGTGIGLYIIKRIIDNAGGEIMVHSELNKGTMFTVLFKP